jgi:hypothetical protein
MLYTKKTVSGEKRKQTLRFPSTDKWKTYAVSILLDFAFFAKALSNRIKAGLLTYSIPYAFPSIDSDVLYGTVTEFTVARQSVILTRFPFNSTVAEHLSG